MTGDELAIRSPEPRSPTLFPIFLKLEGRLCLVVGAGTVGESKIPSLLASDAAVTVVAPTATPKLQAWTREKKLFWEKRRF